MRKSIVLDTAGVLLGSIVLLAIVGQFASLHRWHVGAWNDQVGYVSVARNIVEDGELRSNIIYTSTLKQKATRNYLYMPGHYLTLALSFAVLGVGPLQSVIPSLLSYCLATCCVFLTARRLYGRTAGFLAVGLFALFPVVLGMAFTAMAELTLLAAVSLAVCLFVYLPEKLRPWAGPLLLALPFIFRETTALLVIPMAALVLGGIPLLQRIPWARWRALAIFCLLSVGLLLYIFMSPLSAGRPSLMKVNVFDLGEKGIYQDATSADRISKRPTAWLKAIASNVIKNIQRLPETRYSLPSWHEPAALAALFAAVALSLRFGWMHRDGVALGSGLMGLALLAFLFGLYNVRDYRGVRTLLFAWPLFTPVIAAWLIRLPWWMPAIQKHPLRLATASAGIAAITIAMACRAAEQTASHDAIDDQANIAVESIGHDPTQLLASPYWLGLPYTATHYPVKWAFLPENARTLLMLTKKFDVGTLIIARGSTSLRKIQLMRAGFVFDRYLPWQDQRLSVYKKKRPNWPPVPRLVKRRAFAEVCCGPVRVGIYPGLGSPIICAGWWGRDPAPMDVETPIRPTTRPTTAPAKSGASPLTRPAGNAVVAKHARQRDAHQQR